MKRLVLTVLVLASAVAFSVPANGSSTRQSRSWNVTVTNLTPAGSQPLSPPLVVVHSTRADVWSLGEIASHGVAAIAEDADNSVLESALPMLEEYEAYEPFQAARSHRVRRARSPSSPATVPTGSRS